MRNGGAGGTRTPDPLHAMQVLSQLSYNPTVGPLVGPISEADPAQSPGLLGGRVPRPSARRLPPIPARCERGARVLLPRRRVGVDGTTHGILASIVRLGSGSDDGWHLAATAGDDEPVRVEAYALLMASAGTLANLLFSGMFVARIAASTHARAIGMAGTAMAVPIAVAALVAAAADLGTWFIVLPLIFVAFAVIEVLVDVVLPVEVRASRWLWPYLGAFYSGQWALIGAAFLGSRTGGFLVLASYLLCLVTTFVSYRQVGHGQPVAGGSRATG